MSKIVFTGVILGAAMILPVGMAGAQGTGGATDYPPCSRGVTDKCTQTHEGMGGGHAMGHHHGSKHHGHHGTHHHHAKHHHHEK